MRLLIRQTLCHYKRKLENLVNSQIEKDESTYKLDLKKRIELINWVLENMKNPDVEICDLLESRMNNVVMTINQTHDMLEADKFHSELRILDLIFYQVCSDEIKRI